MNFNHPLILASSSPRRQFLMRQAGFEFKIAIPDIDESFPATLPVESIPAYLAEKKAKVFENTIHNEVVIASDTTVILGREVFNKPATRDEAINMLSRLSGQTHLVITAVCLLSKHKIDAFEDRTEVTFRNLALREVEFYVDHCKPYDKAGAYGAQDCLPPGINPCSKEEIDFLQKIGKPDLIDKSLADIESSSRITIIEKIAGAYFTVMGLPLHKVYSHLSNF